MKSFGSYISKYLVSFVAFILILLFLNAVVFGLTFQKIVTEDYGDSSPQSMLAMTATASTPEQLSDEAGLSHRQLHKTHQQLLFHCSTSTTPHLCAGDAWLGCAVPLFSLLLFQTQNHSQYRTDCVRCGNFGRRKASFTSYQRRTIGNCKQCKQSFFHFE